jgi:histidinol-phosphate/aromatic aminotransferase/cobyric acid decarboxylase-like protein
MKGSLPTALALLQKAPELSNDPDALRSELAGRLGVAPTRVFLTHGASEGNALALFYLHREIRRAAGRAPVVRIPRPEYPPLFDAAAVAGFRDRDAPGADLLVRSDPHNPTGIRMGLGPLSDQYGEIPRWLIDETFREFTPVESLVRRGPPGTWVTGTFTKAFGADAIRVGWVVPAERDVPGFTAFHGLLTDKVPWHSVQLAREFLRKAPEILAEARGVFEANRAALRRALPNTGALAAPVAFDRPGMPDTEPLALRALDVGVLVAPGRYFDDPTGIRLGLTRRSFPADLSAYLEVRAKSVGGPVIPSGSPGAPSPPLAARSSGARTAGPAPGPSGRRAP